MFCVALKMINDKDAACDILQDVFVYYYQKSQNGSTIHQPKSWLMRATINKCIDYSRFRKKHSKIDHLEPLQATEDIIEIKQDEAILKLALSKLKPKEKDANRFHVWVYNNGGQFEAECTFTCDDYHLNISPSKMVFHDGYLYALQVLKETEGNPLRLVRFKLNVD
jgi:hypothetical protein